jgi:hypothetical protein
VLENRDTQDIDICITGTGEVSGHAWQAGVCKYTFLPPA